MTNLPPSPESRRGFLRTAAALAAAGCLPSCTSPSKPAPVAATTTPPPAPPKADAVEVTTPQVKPPIKPPSETLAFGLIGCGGQGTGDAKNASKFGQVVAVCDVDEGHLA